MTDTGPLSAPVTSMNSARALAETVSLTDVDVNAAPAVDRIMRYLVTLRYGSLMYEGEGVLDVLHLLGLDCATVMTQWLARCAPDADSAAYWAELNELTRMAVSL